MHYLIKTFTPSLDSNDFYKINKNNKMEDGEMKEIKNTTHISSLSNWKCHLIKEHQRRAGIIHLVLDVLSLRGIQMEIMGNSGPYTQQRG